MILLSDCFAVRDMSLTSCDGLRIHAPIVYVDFYQINRPCTCIVAPSFVGELLVTMRASVNEDKYICNTEIKVQNSIIFRCPRNMISSQTLNVIMNQLVDVRADYVSPYTSGTFYHCMGLQQNGMIGCQI